MTDTERRLLEGALKRVKEYIAEVGGCDHSVGQCCCEDVILADEIQEVLSHPDGTCRNCYRVDCRCVEIRARKGR